MATKQTKVRTIQFESHRNELVVILEMEHDPEVVEFWDLSPEAKIVAKRQTMLHFISVEAKLSPCRELHLFPEI
jgi:hypothetical protein